MHDDFKKRLKQRGIKLHRPDALTAFLRILSVTDSDILSWYNTTIPELRPNERVWAKFAKLSGLRVSEAIDSFNLIISLSKENKLSQYYDANMGVLCHFKYPKLFIRGTKNAYITFIKPELLTEISNSQPVTYSAIRKMLERKHIPMRFNELRDLFGTTLVNNGVLEMEQNLVCGRIPVSIFIRHYWSPKLKELSKRVFVALETLEPKELIKQTN